MSNSDGAEVIVQQGPPGQKTTQRQQPTESGTCSKLDSMWVLFIMGWVIAPCWWIGVATGSCTGKDSQCLIKRRQDLKPTQVAAWRANLAMTVISTVLVVLVCSIHLSLNRSGE